MWVKPISGVWWKLQAYVIILLFHQMVVLCNRKDGSYNSLLCLCELKVGLWEITLTGDLRCLWDYHIPEHELMFLFYMAPGRHGSSMELGGQALVSTQ